MPSTFVLPVRPLSSGSAAAPAPGPLNSADPALPLTQAAAPAASQATPHVGDAVEGTDGDLGTVAGMRHGAPGPDGISQAFLLVHQTSLWGLRHQTRLVPRSWIRAARPGYTGVSLTGSDADVARCSLLRTDRAIQADVAHALWPGGITVQESAMYLSVGEGVVTLSGHTRSPRETRAALASAWNVPGVVGVVSDRLANDEALTGAVAQALTTNAETRAAHLLVRVRMGAVELEGRVPSEATRNAAMTIAAAVPGVTRVRNGAVVTIPTALPTSPATLAPPAVLD
jgi:osmotically-inducible protein OsmY